MYFLVVFTRLPAEQTRAQAKPSGAVFRRRCFEFEVFINYGSPIQCVSVNALGISQSFVLTPNVINQPIFNSRTVTTSVSVWDDQTVVLGGLMREDVQKAEDRTPIIGDIPIVGRLFRTNTEQHIKRNLVIFVTARLVNPTGQPINSTEEEEEPKRSPKSNSRFCRKFPTTKSSEYFVIPLPRRVVIAGRVPTPSRAPVQRMRPDLEISPGFC